MKKIVLTTILMLFPLSVLFAQLNNPGFGSGTKTSGSDVTGATDGSTGSGGSSGTDSVDPFADPMSETTAPISQHVYEGIVVGIMIAGYSFYKRRKIA